MVCFMLSTTIAFSNEPTHKPEISAVKLEITTHLGDQQNFVENDLISFYISLDQPAYIYAFYQDATGKIFQLIPGLIQKQHFYLAGLYQPLPSENAAFKFFVQQPFGKETIWVYASDNGSFDSDNEKSGDSIQQINMSLREIEQEIKTSSNKVFDRASTVIHTRKK